jgi:hypothetical protein
MKRMPCRHLLLLVLFAIGAIANAAETPRPRVGLVLGGGGARGAAHIGVLEVLERCAYRSTVSPAPAWEVWWPAPTPAG